MDEPMPARRVSPWPQDAERFNPNHAPAGSATGGQFAAASGSSKSGKGGKDTRATPTNQHPVGKGETGKRVSDLQERLNALGAKPPLKTDGIFGPKTLAAVRAFQRSHGLVVDGLVGPKTTAALRARPAAAQHKPAPAPVSKTARRAGDSGIPGHFPHQLAQWWERGAGAAKIRWKTPGDFDRCVRLAVSEAHMDPERARGFCAERHHAATGEWPATHAAQVKKETGRSAVTTPAGDYDGDGLDGSWDGDHSDLPDLAGLGVSHMEAAEKAMGITPPAGQDAQRAMPRLGSGARFAKLKSSLAAKGASDPGALAAYIGRRKFGKARFAKIAGHARGGPKASRSAPGELVRIYPLEDIHILSRAEGDGTGRVVEAYATVFDQEAEIHDHQGHYMEVIDRTAFDQILQRITRAPGGLAAQVKVLFNHGKTAGGAEAPEFQLPLGKPLDVRPEQRGLLTRTEYDAGDPFTERVLSKIHAGTITAQSFVGGIIRSSPELKGPGDRYRGRGGTLTTVRRMVLGLREYGPVLFPAYSGAEILGVRMSIPGMSGEPDVPDDDRDEESAPEGDDAAGTREEVHPSRDHAHRLLAMRTEQMCREAGIGPLKGGW
jgi:HK97 family phage prohead protease